MVRQNRLISILARELQGIPDRKQEEEGNWTAWAPYPKTGKLCHNFN